MALHGLRLLSKRILCFQALIRTRSNLPLDNVHRFAMRRDAERAANAEGTTEHKSNLGSLWGANLHHVHWTWSRRASTTRRATSTSCAQ